MGRLSKKKLATDPGDVIEPDNDSFDTMPDRYPSETGRGDAENLAFLVGGRGSAASSWVESSIDAGDKRLSTDIDDFALCPDVSWSLREGSVDSVEPRRGERRAGTRGIVQVNQRGYQPWIQSQPQSWCLQHHNFGLGIGCEPHGAGFSVSLSII